MINISAAHRPDRPRHRTRLAAAVVALGGVAASIVAAAPTAAAHPGVPSAVFDPAAVGWASVRDLTSAQFGAAFDEWKAKGYLVTDLEVDVTGGDYRVGAVFQRNTDNRTWRSLRDLTEAGYAAAKTAATADGLRQVDIETYVLGGSRRYAAVWVQNKENLAGTSRHDLTSDEFSTWFDQQKAAGRMPVDVEQYPTGAGLRYAAVWVDNAEGLAWKLWRGLTAAEFGAKFDENKAAYRMLAVDSVATGAGQRYAGIWVENVNHRQWRERRDMTATQYTNWWHRYADEGFRLVSYDRYETPAGTRYAGIWRQNSDRPVWAQRAQADARVQAELDSHDVPGISVAIIQNGTYRYLRGFGAADVAKDTWLDSEHVLGLASVSKAVTGTLAMRLAEQGKIKVDDKTSKHLAGLPAQHTHTLKQLAGNRGCVQHYNEGSGFGSDTPYTTALASAQEFWNDPLVCSVGAYHYSTHGYTLLCAAFEGATGQNSADLVESRLTSPYGLGTLRPQRLADPTVRRAKSYATNNAEIAKPDESAKTCGGGMESTVHDLALFGHKLSAGQILSPASLATMWTVPSGEAYGYGWNFDTVAGHRVVAKQGANTGTQSYLRIYPDDGVVVAVMSNRKDGGHDLTQLGRDLGVLTVNS